MRKLLFSLIFFVSTAGAEIIVPDGVITNVVSSFYFYATNDEMIASIPEEEADLFPGEDEELHGYSYCHRDVEKNIAFCEIHQVMPVLVDDEQTVTIGHEVAHGVFGIYHR